MNIYQKLSEVQKELKAPKNQYNSFGKYSYRSCEDILEAVKPLCIEKGLIVTISDEIEVKQDRYYVKAVVTVIDIESEKEYSVTGYAREAENKKGMDDSQVTGATSSYARKYALNGMFAIDDTKDADADEHKKQQDKKTTTKKTQTTEHKFDRNKALKYIQATLSEEELKNFCKTIGISELKFIKNDRLEQEAKELSNKNKKEVK
jgi:hypothetical protein